MRKIFYPLLILSIVLLIVFVVAFIFVSLKGKSIVTAKLEEALKRKVEIGDIKVSFPLNLKITKLDIENLLKADEIHVSFGVINLLRRNIELPALRLLRPQFIIERKETSGRLIKDILPLPRDNSAEDKNATIPSSKKSPDKLAVNVLINKLIIKNGKIRFIDKTLESGVFQLDIADLNLKAHRISFPFNPSDMRVELTAVIATDTKKISHSTIKAAGWINLIRKDMRGDIEINNLDATYFFPYYQKHLSRRLKSANVNFTTELNAKNNDLTADCHLKINDLLFDEPQVEELQDIKILDIIGGGLAKKARDVELEFVIKTKLDKPKIDSAQIRGIVLDKILEEVATQPPQETIEQIKGIGDKVREIGEQLEDKFKSIFKGDQQE